MITANAEEKGQNPVFVLGHKGFIGTHLTNYLQSDHPRTTVDGASLSELDLTVDGAWEELAARVNPHTRFVVLAGVKRQLGDSLGAFESNMKIAVSVARAIEKSRPAHVLYFSSAAVYGEETHNTFISEETPVNPVTFYGIAKFASERLLANAAALGAVPLVILRPPLIYGPGDASNSYGPAAFCRAAVHSKEPTLWGDGTELREFLYVGDACRLVAELLDSKWEGVLNAAGGKSHSFRDVIASIENISGRRIAVTEKPRTKAKADNGFDPGLLKSVLPDFQFTDLEDGLCLTYESYKHHA